MRLRSRGEDAGRRLLQREEVLDGGRRNRAEMRGGSKYENRKNESSGRASDDIRQIGKRCSMSTRNLQIRVAFRHHLSPSSTTPAVSVVHVLVVSRPSCPPGRSTPTPRHFPPSAMQRTRLAGVASTRETTSGRPTRRFARRCTFSAGLHI